MKRIAPSLFLLLALLSLSGSFSGSLYAQKKGSNPPFVAFQLPSDTLHWYGDVGLQIPFVMASLSVPMMEGAILVHSGEEEDGPVKHYGLMLLPVSSNEIDDGYVRPTTVCAGSGSSRWCETIYVVFHRLGLGHPADQWPGRRARVGSVYDPSTLWNAEDRFPQNWYQTRVWINGALALDRSGTHFFTERLSTPAMALKVAGGMKIRTQVSFKPFGTANESKWVPLLDTEPAEAARLHPCNGVEIVP